MTKNFFLTTGSQFILWWKPGDGGNVPNADSLHAVYYYYSELGVVTVSKWALRIQQLFFYHQVNMKTSFEKAD